MTCYKKQTICQMSVSVTGPFENINKNCIPILQSFNVVEIHPKIGSRATPSKRSSPRKTPSKRQQQVVTPTKTATLISEEFRQEFELRRSPRKHAGSPATPATMIKAPVGYSTLKISGQEPQQDRAIARGTFPQSRLMGD